MSEPNICPHCGEEKPTPHVVVLPDDAYCDECYERYIDQVNADYYDREHEDHWRGD